MLSEASNLLRRFSGCDLAVLSQSASSKLLLCKLDDRFPIYEIDGIERHIVIACDEMPCLCTQALAQWRERAGDRP